MKKKSTEDVPESRTGIFYNVVKTPVKKNTSKGTPDVNALRKEINKKRAKFRKGFD